MREQILDIACAIDSWLFINMPWGRFINSRRVVAYYNINLKSHSLIHCFRSLTFGDMWELTCLLINLFFDLCLGYLLVYYVCYLGPGWEKGIRQVLVVPSDWNACVLDIFLVYSHFYFVLCSNVHFLECLSDNPIFLSLSIFSHTIYQQLDIIFYICFHFPF